MIYKPVAGNSPNVGLREAVINGIAPDGSLYLPTDLPRIPRAFFNNIAGMSLREISFVVANMLFSSDIASATIKQIVDRSITFDAPFHEVGTNRFELDLTQGPTRNYNDLSARFLANISEVLIPEEKRFNVLAVMSKDVGNAVADAFSQNQRATTYVIFPAGSVSRLRKTELQAYGSRVIPVEIGASFGQCQQIVRTLLLDEKLQQSRFMLTGNSWNIAILLPRIVHFFYAYSRLAALDKPLDKVVITIPTENLGNVTAAVIARKMGLPVGRFVAIVNRGDNETDLDNEPRIKSLADSKIDFPEISTAENHSLRQDEIEITIKTDNPTILPPDGHPLAGKNLVRSKIYRFGPSVVALKNLIESNNRISN